MKLYERIYYEFKGCLTNPSFPLPLPAWRSAEAAITRGLFHSLIFSFWLHYVRSLWQHALAEGYWNNVFNSLWRHVGALRRNQLIFKPENDILLQSNLTCDMSILKHEKLCHWLHNFFTCDWNTPPWRFSQYFARVNSGQNAGYWNVNQLVNRNAKNESPSYLSRQIRRVPLDVRGFRCPQERHFLTDAANAHAGGKWGRKARSFFFEARNNNGRLFLLSRRALALFPPLPQIPTQGILISALRQCVRAALAFKRIYI